MRYRLLHAGNQRTFVLIGERGDEIMDCLRRFAVTERLSASTLTAIGAFSHAEIGYFDQSIRDYRRIEIAQQVEVLSLLGDVTLAPQGKHQTHVHAVLGLRDGHTRGGHLMQGMVDPTIEMVITESPMYLRRISDPETGLALINVDA